jgi:hypothetical protein
MKFTLAAFTALLAPAAAEIYFKEQFNDDVSALLPTGVANEPGGWPATRHNGGEKNCNVELWSFLLPYFVTRFLGGHFAD